MFYENNEDDAEIEMLPMAGTTPMGPSDEGGYKQTTTTTKTPAMQLVESTEQLLDDEYAENDDAMTKFLDGDRPTSAGEPSHNVPRKYVLNVWCVTTSILLLSLCTTILVTLFGRNLFERAIQNMLHFMVDTNEHNEGEGGFDFFNLCTVFFCIFNSAVFAFFGNIDYLLMVACGYLYGDDEHEWTVGTVVYCISNLIGCSVAFAIGRALFKDKLYFLLSKHEKYRYFQRVFTDHSLLVLYTFAYSHITHTQ